MYEFTIIDITPYLMMVVFLTAIMNFKGNQRQKAWCCFILLFVFASIRYGIGDDYYRYKQFALHEMDETLLDRLEPLSRLMVEIAYHTHYQVFFFLASLLTLYPLYKICLKLSINPAYSLVVYFLFPNFYLDSLSIVRNHIAYVFVLYAFLLLSQKKVTKSLLAILIAFMFHKSALVGLLIFPLFFLRFKKIYHIIVYCVSFVISAAVMSVISAYSDVIPFFLSIEHYAMDYAKEGGRTMTYIINGLCIFHFLLWKKLSILNPTNTIYLAMFNISGCIWNVFLFVDSNIALRLSSFFQIFIIFLVPQYKYCVGEPRRMFAKVSTYTFFLLLFASSFFINIRAYLQEPDKMNALPYQTVFYKEDYRNYVD